jgi:actin-like ATPase involved in cell morphogenesis
MSSGVREIIGFDLGHGETAVARAMLDTNAEPELLEVHGKKTQVTAIGLHPELGIVIGIQALKPKVTNLRIGFKQKPLADSSYRETIRDFLRAYEKLLARQIRGGSESRYLVGCPSGWTLKERENYEELLKESGIENLSVVPESRAALMHAKESRQLDVKELKGSILILDLGSLTADLTLVVHLRLHPTDFGDTSLGGSLIDRAILRHALEAGRNQTELQSILESQPYYRALCELKCREVKENFFSNEDDHTESPARGYLPIGTDLVFELSVDEELIAKILNERLAELSNKSWVEAFRELLTQAKSKLAEARIDSGVLLLTGGASRMGFTHEICKEVFPDWNIRLGSEPEFCIARGLARVGRMDLHVSGFKARVEELCNSDLIQTSVEKELPRFFDSLGRTLADGIVSDAVRPLICDWRNGAIRILAGLEGRISESAKHWLTGEVGTKAIQARYLDWLELLQEDLSRPISELCQEFRLPAGALALEGATGLRDLDSSALSKIEALGELDAVTESIVVAVSYGIFGASFLFLLPHHVHPIGWLIDIAIGWLVLKYGVEGAKEKVKELDIPDPIRLFLLSDKQLDAKCRDMPDEIAPKFTEALKQNKQMFEEFTGQVREQIRKALRARAEEAIILIR